MYILAIDNNLTKYPYSISQLRKDNPQVSFPENPFAELLAEYGVYPVKPTDRPQVDYTKIVSEGTPGFDGEWKQTWVVSENHNAYEIAKGFRAEAYRNESDPLFFKAQRGDATMEEWQAKVAEIKQRYPK